MPDDQDWTIKRIPGVAPGRSSGTAFGPFVWAVAVGADPTTPTSQQSVSCLAEIDRLLAECGTDRSRLLSATIYLADLNDKPTFDEAWMAWVGDNPDHWPQRACIGSALEAGYRVEIVAVAAKASVG